METRHKPCHSHSLMGYQEATGANSRKIKPDFATGRTVKQGTPGLGGVWVSKELYRPIGEHAEGGGAKKNKGR